MQSRKTDRPPLIYSLQVQDRQTGETIGYVANMSDNGLMLVAETPVEAGERRSVYLITPRNVTGGKHLALEAQIRWCRSRRAGHYSVGLELLDLTADAAAELESLMSRFEQAEVDEGTDPYMSDLDPDSLPDD